MILILAFFLSLPAWACGNGEECDDRVACLNDAGDWLGPEGGRANLTLLFTNGSPISGGDVNGDPHPCNMNTTETAALFAKAVNNATELVALRERLHEACRPDEQLKADLVAKLAGNDEPHRYLLAAFKLYAGQAAEAAEIFKSLGGALNPWIKETSSYLVGRTRLIASQKQWSGYEDFETIDKKQLDAADSALTAYLKAYPAGAYAKSARGLLRRVAYFRQDHEKQARLLFAAMDAATSIEELIPLASEVRNSQELILWESPMGATFGVLGALGFALRYPSKMAPEGISRLDKARDAFRKYPGLFSFLKSATYVLQGNSKKALAQKPEPESMDSVITRSHYALFAQILEKEKRFDDARLFWRKIPGIHAEIQLARNYILSGQIEKIVEKYSGVNDPKVRESALRQGALQSSLERIADGNADADKILLGRYLMLGEWKKFVGRIEASPNRKQFEEVETSLRSLAANPKDPKALSNLGYYLQQKKINQSTFGPDACCGKDSPTARAAPELKDVKFPFRYYEMGLEQFKAGEKSEVEAKLLYYALQCFKEGESSWSCLWSWDADKVVPEKTRKAWFAKLKKKYPDSRWSKDLKYYY